MQRLPARPLEARLLLLALTATLLALFSTAYGRLSWEAAMVAAGNTLAFLLTHFVFRLTRFRGDQGILPITAWLSGWGLSELVIVAPGLVERQSIRIAMGLALMAALASFRRFEILKDRKYLIGTSGALLLLVTILFGTEAGGARAWLRVGPLQFQPSEFVKITLVLFLAGYLAETRHLLATPTRKWGRLSVPEPRLFGPMTTMWAISVGILVWQKDLGSAVLYFGVFLAMLYVASGRLSYTAVGIVLALIGFGGASLVFEHVRTRVMVWLNPWEKATGPGYQIVQGLFTLAAGGIAGRNDGLEMATKTPAVHTDLIFAAIGEHWGFLGTTAVLVASFLFVMRATAIAREVKNPFGTLVAAGFAALFAGQVFVIVGGSTLLLPLTGITLPFVSYGGSSVLANFLLAGMLLAVSQGEKSNAAAA